MRYKWEHTASNNLKNQLLNLGFRKNDFYLFPLQWPYPLTGQETCLSSRQWEFEPPQGYKKQWCCGQLNGVRIKIQSGREASPTRIWVRFPQVTNMLQVYAFLSLRTKWHINTPLYLFLIWTCPLLVGALLFTQRNQVRFLAGLQVGTNSKFYVKTSDFQSENVEHKSSLTLGFSITVVRKILALGLWGFDSLNPNNCIVSEVWLWIVQKNCKF